MPDRSPAASSPHTRTCGDATARANDDHRREIWLPPVVMPVTVPTPPAIVVAAVAPSAAVPIVVVVMMMMSEGNEEAPGRAQPSNHHDRDAEYPPEPPQNAMEHVTF